jgi:hypothetical protein
LILAILALVALVGAYAIAGANGLIGMAAALGAGGIGVVALAGTSFLVGRLMADRGTPKIGTTIILLAAFVKFPLLIGAWFFVKRLGGGAEGAFVSGILLVYSALVGWAATRRAADP